MNKFTLILLFVCIKVCFSTDDRSDSVDDEEQEILNFKAAVQEVVDEGEMACDKVQESCKEIVEHLSSENEQILEDCIHIFTEYLCFGKTDGEDLKELYRYFSNSEISGAERDEL